MLSEKFTIYRRVYAKELHPSPTGYADDGPEPVRVFGHSVVSATSRMNTGDQFTGPFWETEERLKILAPVGRLAVAPDMLAVVLVNGKLWTQVGGEILAEANPFGWSPGVATTVWENKLDLPPFGDTSAEPEPEEPEVIPVYDYNPYNDPDNPRYGTGEVDGYHMGAGDTYDPHNDRKSPFYGQGNMRMGSTGPIYSWPDGYSAELRAEYHGTEFWL